MSGEPSTSAVPIALTRQCAICDAFNAENNFGAMVPLSFVHETSWDM